MDNDIGGRKATNTTILTSCLEIPYFRYLRRPYRAALQVTYEAICQKPHADIPRRTRHLDKGNILICIYLPVIVSRTRQRWNLNELTGPGQHNLG